MPWDRRLRRRRAQVRKEGLCVAWGRGQGWGGGVALAGLHPKDVGLLGWCGLSIYGVPGP